MSAGLQAPRLVLSGLGSQAMTAAAAFDWTRCSTVQSRSTGASARIQARAARPGRHAGNPTDGVNAAARPARPGPEATAGASAGATAPLEGGPVDREDLSDRLVGPASVGQLGVQSGPAGRARRGRRSIDAVTGNRGDERSPIARTLIARRWWDRQLVARRSRAARPQRRQSGAPSPGLERLGGLLGQANGATR